MNKSYMEGMGKSGTDEGIRGCGWFGKTDTGSPGKVFFI